jgi:hypothetical protein
MTDNADIRKRFTRGGFHAIIVSNICSASGRQGAFILHKE